MWYLTPEALEILAGITEKPAAEDHKKRFINTVDYWSEFTGPAIEALTGLWDAAFMAAEGAGNIKVLEEILFSSPEDVIGALWGDPNGNACFRTWRDLSDEWRAIRDAVASATGKGTNNDR